MRKPLLLHTCCGPCATAVLADLLDDYQVTAFSYNPNIDTPEEHNKRQHAEQQVADSFTPPVPLLLAPYDPAAFRHLAEPHATTPEGGARCRVCFTLRLQATAQMAKSRGIDTFATTLTISPHKNADTIHSIGTEIAAAHGLTFLPRDFKQNGGFHRSIARSKSLGLYRQSHCGCIYSKR